MDIKDLMTRYYSNSIIFPRWAASWIDLIALALCFLLPNLILGDYLYQKTVLLWLFLMIMYFPLLEGLLGTTIGKFICQLKVVNSQYKNPGIMRASIRTLFRIIEVNPFLMGGLPAGLVVIRSKHKQRLGDMIAKTYVIWKKDIPLIMDNG